MNSTAFIKALSAFLLPERFKKHKYVFLLLVLINSIILGQESKKNTILISNGIGVSNHKNTSGGFGMRFGIGYQRDLWRDRLRLVPAFTIGSYNNKGTTDVADAYHNSFNLSTNLYVDLLKYKSVSFILGTGLTANYITGLKGDGGGFLFRNDSLSTQNSSSNNGGFFTQTNWGLNINPGFRWSPKNHRIGAEIGLLNGTIGFNDADFTELHILEGRLLIRF
jgi:hypothetical protein